MILNNTQINSKENELEKNNENIIKKKQDSIFFVEYVNSQILEKSIFIFFILKNL